MSQSSVNRRDFLKTSAAGAAALSLTAASAKRVLGANDRIGVAFLGVGGRCQEHIGVVNKFKKENKGAEPVAVCDVWDGNKQVGRGLYFSADRCGLNHDDKTHVTKDYRRVLELKRRGVHSEDGDVPEPEAVDPVTGLLEHGLGEVDPDHLDRPGVEGKGEPGPHAEPRGGPERGVTRREEKQARGGAKRNEADEPGNRQKPLLAEQRHELIDRDEEGDEVHRRQRPLEHEPRQPVIG